MPFRLADTYPMPRRKVQFVTSAEMPYLIYQARQIRGLPSNTAYIQRALCAALAADLHLAEQDLLDRLPPTIDRDQSKPIPLQHGHVDENVRE